MAHIMDGVLSLPVLAAGTAGGVAGVALGLRSLTEREIPKVGLMSAVFFVVSLFAVPLGPSSVHLLLGGLMGIVLGARAFPAVLVGLLLQAVLFGFGGLTTLGVDTLNMALPGWALAALFRPVLMKGAPVAAVAVSAGIAALSVLATGGGVALALTLSGSDYAPAAKVVVLAYLPLAAIEAIATAAIVGFLLKVRPDVIGRAAHLHPVPET